MARGIEVREAHFPGRAPIDAYGNGGFRFADMSHRGSVLLLPSGIYGWAVQSVGDLTAESLEPVLAEIETVDVLLIGCGRDLAPVPRDIRDALKGHFISCDSMSTGAAVRTFNVLLAEDRRVAAALVAVDEA